MKYETIRQHNNKLMQNIKIIQNLMGDGVKKNN